MVGIPLNEVTKARGLLRDVVISNPVQFSRTFSNMANNSVYLKPECLQKTGSHKIRGAYYLLSRLSKEECEKGIATFSAGNWAQGAAYAGSLLGCPVTVVMPENANPQKIEATIGYGGEVIQFGYHSTDLFQKAYDLAKERGMKFINPLENRELMIGFGSLGLEILEELPDIQGIIAPVGGGGLIGGIASAVKQTRPDVKIYGVQPKGADAMVRSIKNGVATEIAKVETIADGLAIKKPSEFTFQIIQKTVDNLVLVSENEIKKTMLLLLERAKLLVEPAGAASLAALIFKRIPELSSRKIAVILTGGNTDLKLLMEILRIHL